MEFTLKEFIEKTLCDICDAVDSARKQHDYIAPKAFTDPNSPEKATVVEFDVAVTASEGKTDSIQAGGKAALGVNVSVIRAEASLGSDGSKNNSAASSKESRVRFSVPVYFQFDKEERKRRLDKIKNTSMQVEGGGSWMSR